MQENGDVHIDDQNQDEGGEEILTPRNKYERIMLAASEAARLNEEVRRKGIKLDHKVTLEALKRVDEGKVKGILPHQEAPEDVEKLAASAPRDMLFASPLPASERSSSSEDEEVDEDE
jgi:DNA-directed RNA polymerase subunit K/omega